MRFSSITQHGFKAVLCALSLAALFLAGCTPKEEPVSIVSVSSVALNQTSVTLTVGETASLTATVSPANASEKTVSWSSSNTSVATVNNGTVTAVAVGSATITAKAGSKTATCTVTVKAKEVPVTGITLDPTSVSITVGGTAKLTATVSPADATDKTVTWSSSKESVATVENGTVTAVAVGTATITAKAGSKTATCTVTVKAKEVPVTGITLDPTSVSIEVGKTAKLTATVTPADATNATVTWSSSKESVATVENGTVTAVAVGTATITAKAGDKTATCTVTVTPKVIPVTGITLDPTSVSIEVGKTAKLTATVSPADATDKTVTWSSSRESVATVKDGTVTAVAVGTATITAKAGDKSATCTVTVTPMVIPVTDISIIQTSISIEVGDAFKLTAIVSPSNATDKTITWSSSNESVATVKDGKVTAVAVGTATITAKAGDKTATCEVTVTPDPEAKIKTALMKIYNALDGPHWTITNKWDLSKPLSEWDCIRWNRNTGELEFESRIRVGMKGQLPDCFDELTGLTTFFIQDEPGLTGPLPASFAQLKNLRNLSLVMTSITSLPDIFSGMPLEEVFLSGNESLTGPLPESLGSSPSLLRLYVAGNNFTGTVPDSWAKLGTKLVIGQEPSLDARVPDSFVTAADASYLVNMYIDLAGSRETPIVVGDYDIPAFWPKKGLKDIVTGESIPYKEICAKNKVTVLLNWATWCPFSKEFMPILKRMYEKYHKDGLEIIAAYNTNDPASDDGRPLKDVLLERGYDQWYNFHLWDLSATEWSIWCAGTPSATLVDKDGKTIASSETNVSDPVRNRFGYTASDKLIPTLESLFGPVEGDDSYESVDYSKDGKVLTIQKSSTGKGINLVFMGDAYTDKDIESGQYERMMRNAADQFFSIEPYKSFKDRFNVYAVTVVSKNGRTGAGYTTALGTQFVNGSAGTGNEDKIYEYALMIPGISDKKDLTIGVLVNTIYFGGIATMSESLQSGIGYFASNGNDPSAFGNTIRHEVGGHAFAFLADEYATNSGSIPQATINEYNRLYKAHGWYANVDFTNDTKKVKWADFLSDSRYKDKVGVYEGGANFAKGAYRPSPSSMMNDNMEYYNAPSRWAIYQRIMKLSGESCTFDKFLQYDAVNRSQPHPAPRPSNYVEWGPDPLPIVRP